MGIEELKKGDLKEKIVTIRITEKQRKWLKQNKISPTKLFRYAIKQVKRKIKNEQKD